MNTVKKAAVLTAAACAMVMSGAGVASADGNDGATAEAAAIGSPGFLSGNVFQVPINMPINNCGNSLGLFAILNPAFGNTCINASVHSRFHHRHHHAYREHGVCEERGEFWGGHGGRFCDDHGRRWRGERGERGERGDRGDRFDGRDGD